MRNQYLTAKQVADLFQLNLDTVYDLVGAGQIPATKIGGRWRFDESELRTWFRTHRSAGFQHAERSPGVAAKR